MRDLLSNGPVAVSRIKQELARAGLPFLLAIQPTVKERLGITSRRTAAGWVWEMGKGG